MSCLAILKMTASALIPFKPLVLAMISLIKSWFGYHSSDLTGNCKLFSLLFSFEILCLSWFSLRLFLIVCKWSENIGIDLLETDFLGVLELF